MIHFMEKDKVFPNELTIGKCYRCLKRGEGYPTGKVIKVIKFSRSPLCPTENMHFFEGGKICPGSVIVELSDGGRLDLCLCSYISDNYKYVFWDVEETEIEIKYNKTKDNRMLRFKR